MISFQLARPGPLKIFGSNGEKNTPEVPKNQGDFKEITNLTTTI